MIAIVYPQFYGVGGIARYIESFLENLPADEHIMLITGDEGRTPKQFDRVKIVHIPVSKGRFSLIAWSLKARALVQRLYKTGQIRGVNFHFPPLIPGIFLPKNVPMVLTAHTTYIGMSGQFYEEKHFDSPWSPSSLKVKRWMERRAFRQASAVITLTEQGRQEVMRYGYKGPTVIIPNGVDLNKFTPRESPNKDIDVLFVGRIELRKGSRPMVDLCRELVSKDPQVRIAIVGYGDDDEYVSSALSCFPKNVNLAGKVPFDQVADFYNRSRVYASTSYYEGLPGTCLEAMAMGLPAVVWDLLFYRGLVDAGRSGVVVPVNDIAAMANAILTLKESPETCRSYGAEGRSTLASRYDWPLLASQVCKVFAQHIPH